MNFQPHCKHFCELSLLLSEKKTKIRWKIDGGGLIRQNGAQKLGHNQTVQLVTFGFASDITVKLLTPDHLETVVLTKTSGICWSQIWFTHVILLLYVTFCKNRGICWSEHFMVRSWLVRGSEFHCSFIEIRKFGLWPLVDRLTSKS
jgi:hypothetical protein